MSDEKALVKRDIFDLEPVNQPDEALTQILDDRSKENLEGVTPRLPKIQMPTGRGKEFTIDRPGEEKQDLREIVGIILYHSPANAWWKEAFGQGNASISPDCASHDGIKPSAQYPNLQSDFCASCKHNQFGSKVDPVTGAKTRGKACRNVKRVIVLIKGDPIPLLLTVPPTSLRVIDDFMVKLRKEKRPYYSVGTKITLVTETSNTGIEYPAIKLDIAGFINDVRALDELMAMRKEWTDLIQSTMFTNVDAGITHEGEASYTPPPPQDLDKQEY